MTSLWVTVTLSCPFLCHIDINSLYLVSSHFRGDGPEKEAPMGQLTKKGVVD